MHIRKETLGKIIDSTTQEVILNKLLLTENYEEISVLLESIQLDVGVSAKFSESISSEALRLVEKYIGSEQDVNENEEELLLLILRIIRQLPESSKTVSCYLGERLGMSLSESHESEPAAALHMLLPVLHVSDPSANARYNTEKLIKLIQELVMVPSSNTVNSVVVADVELARQLLYVSLTRRDEIGVQCSNLLKWWIPAILDACETDNELDNAIWLSIQSVIENDASQTTVRNAFVFWLRFIMEGGFTPAGQELIQVNSYWNLIHLGLSRDVHEIKKIVLSILKATLQLLKEKHLKVETSLLSFQSRDDQVESWKRFITLYEIWGVDTALNQCEASAPDLLGIFEDRNIGYVWGLTLLSAGLNATMESVRKLSLRLMLKVKNKGAFEADKMLLKEVFLPATMQASFYNVSSDRCEYGESVSHFVRDVILSSKQKAAVIQTVLLTLYDCRKLFDAAKVYIAVGLLEGLETNGSAILKDHHINLVKSLFVCQCEEKILQTTLQCTFLKYMLFSNVSKSVFLETLVAHVQFTNTYEYIEILMEALKAFYSMKFMKSDQADSPVVSGEIANVLLYELEGSGRNLCSDQFLIEYARTKWDYTKLSQEYALLQKKLIDGTVSEYKRTRRIASFPLLSPSDYLKLDFNGIFRRVSKTVNADELAFFADLYESVTNIIDREILPFESVKLLYAAVCEHMNANKSLSFKNKDELCASFFKFMHSCLKYHYSDYGKTGESLKQISAFIDANPDYYQTNLEITSICLSLQEQYAISNAGSLTKDVKPHVNDMLLIQCKIWDSLTLERLVLNQQPLHIALIRGIFHRNNLLYVLDDPSLAENLLQYGLSVLDQSSTRRSLRPHLAEQLMIFMEKHGLYLMTGDYRSLNALISQCFVQESMDQNIFTLKPVIAQLFDTKLNLSISGGLYRSVYGVDELFSRGYIIKALLCATKDFREQFLSFMLAHDPNLLKAKKKTDGPEEVQRMLKWQLCLITMKSVNNETLTKIVSSFVLPCLVQESSPLVRVYCEWFIAFNIWQSTTTGSENPNETAVFDILNDFSAPVLQTSAERVLFLALQAAKKGGNYKQLMKKFISQLLVNCSSNKPLIRHFSNSLIILFWPLFKHDIEDPTLGAVVSNLYKDATKLQIQGQFRAGDANTWHIDEDLNLTDIFGGVLLKILDHSVPYIESKVFLAVGLDGKEFPVGTDEKQLWLSRRKIKDTKKAALEMNSPLQTKSGAWEVIDNDTVSSIKSVKRSNLIVVASLVDKPPNLGGICRLCDVLGVGAMTVHDIRVKQHPQFKSVAVTADRWMPIIEQPVDDLLSYFKTKKLEGYTLIGLEQTDSSIQLNSKFEFPTKSLILLGTEAHGIPGHLLKELDLCLEIKQSGVIRSMNIQTATAVIVYSYSIQHL